MSCQKIPFQSKLEAQKFIKGMRRSVKGNLRPYKCPRCPNWHMTKKSRNEEKQYNKGV